MSACVNSKIKLRTQFSFLNLLQPVGSSTSAAAASAASSAVTASTGLTLKPLGAATTTATTTGNVCDPVPLLHTG